MPTALLKELAHIPAASTRNVTLRVDRSGERALRKRHPWLFADGIVQQSHQGQTGDFAVVFDRGRKFLAIGLYDPGSPIRVRVLHSGKPLRIDSDFFRRRFAEAALRRAPLLASRTTGHRLVNGENEGMPGLIVDRYSSTLVIKLYTPAWLPHLSSLLPGLIEVQPCERIVLRLSRDSSSRPAELYGLADGSVLYGPALDGPVVFEENGLEFECDVVHGQKTGFFLDQRDNRARVERLAKDKRMLNVFAYTGGFSLYAARGGARRVTSVDQSRPALANAERNFARNAHIKNVVAAEHEIVAGDAFEYLASMKRRRSRFDLVVIDPPSFANRAAEVEGALAAYARLTKLGLSVLTRGGHIVLASCSARVTSDDFFLHVTRTALECGRPLHELERSEHAIDHPVGFQHGAYLKCLFARSP